MVTNGYGQWQAQLPAARPPAICHATLARRSIPACLSASGEPPRPRQSPRPRPRAGRPAHVCGYDVLPQQADPRSQAWVPLRRDIQTRVSFDMRAPDWSDRRAVSRRHQDGVLR